MRHKNNYTAEEIADKIIRFSLSRSRRFIFISGNGGAGKTELSTMLSQRAQQHGHTNIIDMDDFVVDTALRSSATVTWNDPEKGPQSGRYTTAFPAAYFLPSVKAILYNIEKGSNYYHWPKKASNGADCRLLHGDAIVTIIDGSGTVFLNRNPTNSLSIFMQCNKELEIARRIARKRFSNEQDAGEVRKQFAERTSQYKVMIHPHITEYALVLESMADYSINVSRDDVGISDSL